MPAFSQGYEYDVFISYAHVDNQQFTENDRNTEWVSCLVDRLKKLLAHKLGRSGAQVWLDHLALRGNEPVTPDIAEAISKTATLLVILSQVYLESAWCRRELSLFVESAGGAKEAAGRIFVVARSDIDQQLRPEAIRDFIGYKFYELDGKAERVLGWPSWPSRHASDQLYTRRLVDLGTDLADKLRRLRTPNPTGRKPDVIASPAEPVPATPVAGAKHGRPSAAVGAPRNEAMPTPVPDADVSSETNGMSAPTAMREVGASADSEGPTVFLAEVPEPMEELREEICRHLLQENIHVLPRRDDWYPRAPMEFEARMRADLERCVLFAQLLSNKPPRRTPDLPNGYDGLQYETAISAGKQILRWRDPDAKLEDIERDYPKYFAQIAAGDVTAQGIEEFKRSLVEKAGFFFRRANLLVRMQFDQVDAEVADEVARELLLLGIGYEGDMGDLDAESLTELSYYHGLMVFFGRCDAKWARKQLRFCHAAMSRSQVPQPHAVYEGPPVHKPQKLLFNYAGLLHVDGRASISTGALIVGSE